MTTNSENGLERKRLWPICRYHPGIRMDWVKLRKLSIRNCDLTQHDSV